MMLAVKSAQNVRRKVSSASSAAVGGCGLAPQPSGQPVGQLLRARAARLHELAHAHLGSRGHPGAEQRERDVVLGDLGAGLAAHALQVVLDVGPLLLAGADGVDVQVVHRHAPLEEGHEEQVQDRLPQVPRVPLLLGVDAHDLVAQVLVQPEDVRVRVVDVVVGVLPRLLGGGGVPVPVRGVDDRVVHPVPLAVHHVVADLHVLQDLGRAQRRRAQDPHRLVLRGQQLERGRSAPAGGAGRSCRGCTRRRARRGSRTPRRGGRRTPCRWPRSARRSACAAGFPFQWAFALPSCFSKVDLDRALGRVDAGADGLPLVPGHLPGSQVSYLA